VTNFDDAVQSLKELGDALEEMMLAANSGELVGLPGPGTVTLDWHAYGYPGIYTDPPDHWIPYATPSWMRTRGERIAGQTVGVRPVQYNQKADNLKQRIWDPGYYLDLLVSGFAQYISLLTAIEPAFRATGHKRGELKGLASQLHNFVHAWKQSLLVTIPEAFFSGAGGNESFLYHPYRNPYNPSITMGIPIGVIDPVSGLSTFNPVWNEGIQFGPSSYYLSIKSGVVTNTTEVLAGANAALNDIAKTMMSVCGIDTLQGLADQVTELCEYGLYGSQFSKIERLWRPKSAGSPAWVWPLIQLGQEQLSLGDIGVKAGKPGKLYNATRVYDNRSRRFRIPIVRRMDGSRIQLGYRLTVNAEKENGEIKNCVISTFNSVSNPYSDPNYPVFPTTPPGFDFSVADATVYDVVQRSLLSEDEEQASDVGATNNGLRRLFINPRPGNLGVRCDISLELYEDETHPYIGYATIEVSLLDPEMKDAFLLHFKLYETAKVEWSSYDPSFGVHNETKEILADSIVLPMIPSYLVAEPAYFEDRLKGLLVFDKSIQYLRPVDPHAFERPTPEPKWHYRDIALQELATITAFAELERSNPEFAMSALARFQRPSMDDLQRDERK
jgi:hypothetical protein